MKQLQNNFTTLEQSNRLLELGVPAWTADCYYYEEGGISKDCTPNIIPLGEVWIDESKETMFSSYVDVPCWSVGRLMEIFDICNLYELHKFSTRDWSVNIKSIMEDYEVAAEEKMLDFSKLEE